MAIDQNPYGDDSHALDQCSPPGCGDAASQPAGADASGHAHASPGASAAGGSRSLRILVRADGLPLVMPDDGPADQLIALARDPARDARITLLHARDVAAGVVLRFGWCAARAITADEAWALSQAPPIRAAALPMTCSWGVRLRLFLQDAVCYGSDAQLEVLARVGLPALVAETPERL